MTESRLIKKIQLFIDLSACRHTYNQASFWKLFYNNVPKFLLVTFSILFLAGCSPKNDPESQSFLNKIIDHFYFSDKPILLSSITEFTWDSVCAFYADDSNRNATKNWVIVKLVCP